MLIFDKILNINSRANQANIVQLQNKFVYAIITSDSIANHNRIKMPRCSHKKQLLRQFVRQFEIRSVVSASEDLEEEFDIMMRSVQLILSRRYYSKRQIQLKSIDWYESVLLNLPDEQFKTFIRVNKRQFNQILRLIGLDPVFVSTTNQQMDLRKQLAIVLWRFGHNGVSASYDEVGHRFGVGCGGTIINVTRRIIQALVNMKSRFIFWPDRLERAALSLEMINALPGCVGFVDGTHVNLENAPNVDTRDDYYSRKQRYGLHLQVVCDINLRIRHMKVGRTAAAHDAKVFSECGLARIPNLYFSQNEWLAGDAAYKLTEYLITPFRANSTIGLASQRRAFNYHFSKYRVKIEQVYGVLKEKFCSLKELRIQIDGQHSHIFACQWIEACCVTYNILKTTEEFAYPAIPFDEEPDQYCQDSDSNEGEQKRISLMKWFLKNQA